MATIPSLSNLVFSPFFCLLSPPFHCLTFTPCCHFTFVCLHCCHRFTLLFQELLVHSLQFYKLCVVGRSFIGGHRVLVSRHCVESGIVDQNDQCGKCHVTRWARIQKGNLWGSFSKGRHCYDPDIPCHWIGLKVPQESMCLIALRGLQPPVSHIMPWAMRMLVSIPIHWLITSHFLEPFCSYLY